jgi:hypothetical protein
MAARKRACDQLLFLLPAIFARKEQPTTYEKHWFSAGKLLVLCGSSLP